MTEGARSQAIESLREVCATDRIAYLDALQAWWVAGDAYAANHDDNGAFREAFNRLVSATKIQEISEDAFRNLVHSGHCERFSTGANRGEPRGAYIDIDADSELGEMIRRIFGEQQ
jgi:hypothetical protein